MDFHPYHQKQQACHKHNQPIVLFNQDGPCCVACLQQLPGNISIEKINQQQKEIYDKVIKQIDMDHQSFQDLSDQLLQFRNVIIQSLDKISQLIYDQLNTIKESKQKMESQIKSNKNQKSMIDDLQLASNKQQQFNKDAKDQIRKLLQSFQLKYTEIDKFYTFLEDKQIGVKQQVGGLKQRKIQIQEVQVENASQFNKFQYELIKDSIVKQEIKCYSFAFNKDNTILVIGSWNEIIVYEFINERISKELQRLHDHFYSVNCLYFMKQSNSFVSGSGDDSIIIWTLDNNNKWIAQQVLKVHNYFVICILMNKIEDQMIQGSWNCTLKFWKKKTGSWACSQSISTKLKVQNVSLNEMEDKLIVCENNYESKQTTKQMSCIQILMYQNNQQWSIVQTIDIPEHGWRSSFTIGDQFVFATGNSDYLQVYDYDTGNRQFEVVSQIKIQNVKDCNFYFPCQFIKQLNILIYKHGKFLNIFKVNEKKNYELMYIEINFKSNQYILKNGQFILIGKIFNLQNYFLCQYYQHEQSKYIKMIEKQKIVNKEIANSNQTIQIFSKYYNFIQQINTPPVMQHKKVINQYILFVVYMYLQQYLN